MVTYLQFYKAVRSYHYRQSLLDKLADLEGKIINFLKANETFEARVPGYLISLENGKPIIRQIPFVPLNQLKIEFKEDIKAVVQT